MAVLATDNFNRANNVSLGTNWTNPGNPNWSANGLQIVSNHVEPEPPVTSDKMEFYNAVAFPDDQYSQVQVTVTGTDATTGLGPIVRSDAAGACYRAQVSKAALNNLVIELMPGWVILGTRTVTWVDGDTLRLEAQGSTLRVYQNGVQLGGGITDTTIASGQPGMNYSAVTTVYQMDNWEGGSLDTMSPSLYWIRA